MSTANPFDRLTARLCLLIALLAGLATWLALTLVSAISERALGVAIPAALDDPFAQAIGYAVLGVLLSGVAHTYGVQLNRLVGPPVDRASARVALGTVLPLVALSLAGVFLCYVPLSFPFPGFVESFLLDDPDLFPAGRPLIAVANAVLLVVLAPVVEELVFRGVVFTRWTHRYGPDVGIFGSAATFAVLHADMIGGFAFGLVQVVLYARTRSLRVPMLVHAGNNALVLVLIAADAYLPRTDSLESFRAAWWLGAVGAGVGVPWLVWFLRSSGPRASWRPPYLAREAPGG